jgi:hypothetical protein
VAVFKSGYYRIIVKKTIKHLATPDLAPSSPDIRGKRLGFSAVLDGSWNVGYLNPEACTIKFSWGSAKEQSGASVEKIWHPHKVDYLGLGDPQAGEFQVDAMKAMFFEVYNNPFETEKVIVSTEWCPEDI